MSSRWAPFQPNDFILIGRIGITSKIGDHLSIPLGLVPFLLPVEISMGTENRLLCFIRVVVKCVSHRLPVAQNYRGQNRQDKGKI